MAVDICPYLGPSSAQGRVLPYPFYQNRCYVTGLGVAISTPIQARFCLGGQYTLCPRFRVAKAGPKGLASHRIAADKTTTLSEAAADLAPARMEGILAREAVEMIREPSRSRGGLLRWLFSALVLIGASALLCACLGGLAAYMGIQEDLWITLTSHWGLVLEEPTAIPTSTATPTPTLTATSTPTLTATSTPTLTMTPTSKPTVMPTSTPKPIAMARPTLTPTASPSPSPVPTSARPPANSSPTRIVAPAINLDAKVVEVGWQSAMREGRTVSVWQVADYAAGFHKGTAYPGNVGNTVLSGHHNIKGEVFRYVVDLEPGDEVDLYVGDVIYRYVVESKDIFPEKGLPLEQRRENAKWIDPTDDERLTLVTCWPYTSNTHRVIVVARPLE